MLALYLLLYSTALLMMVVGLVVPALFVAAAAHSLSHRKSAMVAVTRIKPIRNIHG